MKSPEPTSATKPTKVEVPKEIPKVSMVNTSLKKLNTIVLALMWLSKNEPHPQLSLRARGVRRKEMVIKKLKERIKSLSGNMKEDKIKKELKEIETINIELDHRNLRKLKGKAVISHPIDPEMLKVDVAPLAPKLWNNRTVHSDYLKHTQEETATLREIVKQGRSLNPLNTSLDYACDKLMAVTLMYKTKRVRFTEPVKSLGNTNIKTTFSSNIVSSKPMLSSTRINLSTSASRSQPSGNAKKDKIQQTPSSTKKNKIKAHLRTVRSSLRNKNYVVKTKVLMDLCGPMHVESVNGKKYILVIVDDYSRFTSVKCLRSKDKAPDFRIKFLKLIQVGISHETFVARSPQQNGVVERRNRTLIEAACTLLLYDRALLFLWAEAVATAFAPEPAASTGLPSSTTVDQDAPSPSNSQTIPEPQSSIISNDVEDDNHELDKLTEAPILVVLDWNLPFELMCDASDFAIGAFLGQRKMNHFQPIHYASKTIIEAQIHNTITEKEMLAVVHQLSSKLRKVSLYGNEGIVLGHKISKNGFEVDRAKVDVIAKLPHPTTVKGVRSFLGHAGFYRRFIQDFSKIARPMTHFLKKETPFVFSKDCIDAFETLKKKLTEAPILVVLDWNLPFELMFDASDFAIGAFLGQRKMKHFQPIHYASKTIIEAQIHNTTTEKEMLAVVYAFEKFRPYLVLSKSIMYTNQSVLKYLLSKQDAKP
nr:reverse transcriptase domain-containing protein [Tanacetum cinerariifolium]